MPLLRIHYGKNQIVNKNVLYGTSLMCALGPDSPYLEASCGGNGKCGKCIIQALGALSAPSAQEIHLLGSQLDKHWRLACMAYIQGEVDVWPIIRPTSIQIQVDGERPIVKHQPMFRKFGVAIDVGTTTLAAQLFDNRGQLRAQASMINPQYHFGADVITRIEKALTGNGEALSRCICKGIDQLLYTLSIQGKIPLNQIDTLVITGNTTMLYLLTAHNPSCLSHAPFEIDEKFGKTLCSTDIMLTSLHDVEVYVPRCISAFVGADTVTALLSSRIFQKNKCALLVDIGTNGELALWNNDKLSCCATAAGPAFEGCGISQGMQGTTGAIDRVTWHNGTLHIHTIGNIQPKGLCGSGLIDAIAAFLLGGLIDKTGVIQQCSHTIYLTPEVFLTQQDIRIVQQAKAAICAGIYTILQCSGISINDLEKFYIAGGFGSYLDIGNAALIHLIPPELVSKSHVLGNAALSGAAMLLLDKELCSEATQIAESASVLDLSTNSIFYEDFINCMGFQMNRQI